MSQPRGFGPLTWTVIIRGNLLNLASHYFNTELSESIVGAPQFEIIGLWVTSNLPYYFYYVFIFNISSLSNPRLP